MPHKNYTLSDEIYRKALAAGLKGEMANIESKLMVVGGAAAQYYTLTPSLQRPTTDIDITPSNLLTKEDMRVWGKYVSDIIEGDGYRTNAKKSHFGYEVSLVDLEDILLIHLDAHNQNFFRRNQKKIDGEFERANYGLIENYLSRIQRAEDIIVNKLRRLAYLIKNGSLSPQETQIFEKIKEGMFDDIATENMDQALTEIGEIRSQNLEKMSRMSYGGMIKEVERYKAKKDLYDIMSLANSQRNGKIKLDKGVFLEAIKISDNINQNKL